MNVGIAVSSFAAPGEVPEIARAAERAGFADLWVPEDYCFGSATVTAALALAATSRMPVGTGVAALRTRHPMLLAMEYAGLAGAFPGRVRAGVGLGGARAMRELGLGAGAGMDLLRDGLGSLRQLLSGEDSRLGHPPTEAPPLYLGAMGPAALRLAGELADGTLLGIRASAEYLRWAVGQVDARSASHQVVAYVLFAMDDDSARARQAARRTLAFYLAATGPNVFTDHYGISDELTALLSRGGLERTMPDSWVEDLMLVGDPAECRTGLSRYARAGVDGVVLVPVAGGHGPQAIERAGSALL